MMGMGIDEAPWLPLSLVDEATIDAFSPVWDCNQSTDHIKYKLLRESLINTKEELKQKDLEIRRKDIELKRKEEEKNHLAHLLKLATEERDIAKGGIQLLLNKISLYDLHTIKGDGSSSTSESDSPSATHNHHQALGFGTIINANSFAGFMHMSFETSSRHFEHDNASLIIDALAKQRPLPEKGKLLQAVHAVTRATPLLETLLMTGTLPEWRNPPPSLPSPWVLKHG